MGSIASISHRDCNHAIRDLDLGSQKARLTQFGLIEIKGQEVSKFLQSLVTSDVKQINPEHGQFSSWCDGKGRVQAAFWLIPLEDAIYLVTPKDMVESLITRLQMFVLRTKVTLRNASADMALLGLFGPFLVPASSDSIKLPDISGAVIRVSDCALMLLPGAGPLRYLALGSKENIEQLSCGVFTNLPEASECIWSLLDIVAGIPRVGTLTAGEFIPQMLSLEALGALSFTKGCYPGQEVVARLQYRGQLKRRIYRAIIEANEVPLSGTRLASPDSQESVGQVLAAERLGSTTVLVQVVVVIERKESNGVYLASLEGPQLVFESNEGMPQFGEALNGQ